MILDGVRVLVTSISSTVITLGAKIIGFRNMVDAAAVDTRIYSWVIEANFVNGVAQDREGGYGAWGASGNTLGRTTVWSTETANAQITITGVAHLFITPLSPLIADNGTIGGVGDADFSLNVFSGATVTNSAVFTAPRTWTLPPASTHANRTVTIADWYGAISATNYLTIDGDGSETIEGALTYILRYKYASVTLRSNGTSWNVVSTNVHVNEDVLIESSFSGAFNLDIVLTPYLARGYKSFKFRFHNITVSVSDEIKARTSTDGGSSFAATGYKSVYKYHYDGSAAGVWAGSNTTVDGLGVMYGNVSTGNHAESEVILHEPEVVGMSIMSCVFHAYWAANLYWNCVNSVLETSADVDAIRFTSFAGNWACSYSMIGRR